MKPKITKHTKGGAMVTVTSWRRLVQKARRKHKIMKFFKVCARVRTAHARHNETLTMVHLIDVQMRSIQEATETIKRIQAFQRVCK